MRPDDSNDTGGGILVAAAIAALGIGWTLISWLVNGYADGFSVLTAVAGSVALAVLLTKRWLSASRHRSRTDPGPEIERIP